MRTLVSTKLLDYTFCFFQSKQQLKKNLSKPTINSSYTIVVLATTALNPASLPCASLFCASLFYVSLLCSFLLFVFLFHALMFYAFFSVCFLCVFWSELCYFVLFFSLCNL